MLQPLVSLYVFLSYLGLANVPGMNPSPPLGHGHNGGGGLVMSSFTIRN